MQLASCDRVAFLVYRAAIVVKFEIDCLMVNLPICDRIGKPKCSSAQF